MEAPELVEIVRRLRAQRSDDGYVEAKTAVGGLPKDVWPSISAFANTNGGTVILGLNEKDNFRPAEGFTPGPSSTPYPRAFRRVHARPPRR